MITLPYSVKVICRNEHCSNAPNHPSIKHSRQLILESRQYTHNDGVHQNASGTRFITEKALYKFPLSQPIVESENESTLFT